MIKMTITLFSLLFACVLTMNAEAAVIDFESLAHNDDGVVEHGSSYEEDGFLLVNASVYPFATFGQQSGNVYSGSTALFNDNDNGETILTKADGGWFQLNSIALAELNPTGDSFSVTFTGWLHTGAAVTQTFSLDGLPGAQTFVFDDDFTQLTSVHWLNAAAYHQFDDIDVAPVPEPSTMLLFAAGLLTVAVGRRKGKDN